MHDREEIARRYGFSSFAELLDISAPLPMGAGDTHESYLARHPKGHWFVWDDAPEQALAPEVPPANAG